MSCYIASLIRYGLSHGLIAPEDAVYARNQLLMVLGLDAYEAPARPSDLSLEEILAALTEDAVARGLCEDNAAARDLFDTRLMGVLTPRPSQVQKKFRELYEISPKIATDWYYSFSKNTDYIRTYRIKKDLHWKTPTPYGELDITVNLSKPEKDPRAIAAAKQAPQVGYPKCLLCAENEGYAGRMNHPPRQNHRLIPVKLAGEDWFLQYSPYVYYNEHCIVLSSRHAPMKIDRSTFQKLLDFVTVFPHYFLGSNADLPIVGGSILSHEHFQGGRQVFPMERAKVETPLRFQGFEDVAAGIVAWPMSVIRLQSKAAAQLIALADRILTAWRVYTDEEAMIFSQTDGEPHNTITPIARRRGEAYELDLVLRNNLTTREHPLGLYHPHAELHHIKKENIGLIEVMGLAVLPSRLKKELALLKEALLQKQDVAEIAEISKHAAWIETLKQQYTFTPENTEELLRSQVGKVFAKVLEQAGVYPRNERGKEAFLRFLHSVSGKLAEVKG